MSDDVEKPNGGKPPKLAVLTLPTKCVVIGEHLANLQASGLTPETIELAKLYSEFSAPKLAALLQRKRWTQLGGALVFPFYLPGDSAPYGYRVRPSHPRVDRKGKPVKYDQPDLRAGGEQMIYFPPRARAGQWFEDVARTLFWTEGEKKSLVLDQLGLAVIGLTGVWNWGDVSGKAEHGERLDQRLTKHVRVAGREHVIVYDADSHTNDKVMLAAARLCGVLLAAGAAAVRFVCPPELTHKGIDDYFAAHGERPTHALLATAQPLEPADPKQPLARVRSLAALRDATLLPDSLRMPDGYDVQKDGSLWAAGDDKRGASRVTYAPMFSVRTLVDHYSGEERVDLAFARGDGAWSRLCASRKAVADSRTMVSELAPYGAPVTSGTSSKLVDWLHAFEAANTNNIPRVVCVGQSGWHSIDRTDVFAAHQTHAPEDSNVQLALDTRGDRGKIFAALKPRGELEAHVRALRRAWLADPVCAAMVCAAFATPLLMRLRAANFAMHLHGDSSRGKTSKLKIAASVFGDPNSQQWLASWNVSPSALELRAALLNDLPQCYDEVGSADAQEVERMVYTLINGGGRSRATRDLSMRETQSWRTILLSSGEREITDEETATGAQVRVVQFPVQGFGKLTAAEIDALVDECAEHSGQAGADWLARLVECDDWEPVREQYREMLKRLRKQADGDALQGRIAAYFALLAVCEAMLADAFGLGTTQGDTMIALFDDMGAREQVQSAGVRARELVDQWDMSEPDLFPLLDGPEGYEDEPKSRGRTRAGFKRADGTLLIIPSAFEAFCKEHRLSMRSVLREWARSGVLLHDTDGRLTKKVRLGRSLARFYVLPSTSGDNP